MELDNRYREACKLIDRKELDKALHIINEVLEDNPNHHYALNKKGVIFAIQNKIFEAEEMFKKCLEVNAEYAPAIVNIGNISKHKGDNNEAIRYYEQAIKLDEEYYFSYHNLACVYKSMGNYPKYFSYIKKYKRYYRHHINDEKREISQNIGKSQKYVSAVIIALIILVIFIIGVNLK